MKIQTKDLTGAALNWAVAKCESLLVSRSNGGSLVFDSYQDCPPEGAVNDYNDGRWQCYHPSTNWAQGGPIIEREIIMLDYDAAHDWEARDFDSQQILAHGPTPLIAAMRCFVASKMGAEIEVPEELA